MNYLLDTGFLYALLNQTETWHAAVVEASEHIRPNTIYLPTVVMTEVAYLILRDLGNEAVAAFADMLTTESFVLVEPLLADYSRAAAIIRQYADSRIDFVDAVLVAIAERLNITQILTLDQRHFHLIRPKHCAAFELLP